MTAHSPRDASLAPTTRPIGRGDSLSIRDNLDAMPPGVRSGLRYSVGVGLDGETTTAPSPRRLTLDRIADHALSGAVRPYRDLDADAVYRAGVRAFEAGDRAGWSACAAELRRRKSAKAHELADRLRTHGEGGALRRGSREALCEAAREAALALPAGTRGRHRVYVVLLHAMPGGPEWGFYVGMTGKTPEARYREHLEGTRDGRGYVRDYAVELLPAVYARLNPMPLRDAEEREFELAEALRAAGLFVRGGH